MVIIHGSCTYRMFRSLVITVLLAGCTMMEGIIPNGPSPSLSDAIKVKERLDRNRESYEGLTAKARGLQARVSASEVLYRDLQQQEQELEYIGSQLQRLDEAWGQLPIQPSYQQLFVIQEQHDEIARRQINIQDRLSEIDNKLAKGELQEDMRFDKQLESFKEDGRRIEEKLHALQEAVEDKQELFAQGGLGKRELSVLQDRQQALEQDVNNIQQDWENIRNRHDFLEEDKAELRELLERLDKRVKGLGQQVKGLEQRYASALQDKQQPVPGDKPELEKEMPPEAEAESTVMVAPPQTKREITENLIRVGSWGMEKHLRPSATQQQAEQTCEEVGLALPPPDELVQIAKDLSAPAEWAAKVNAQEAFAVRRDGVAVIEFRSLELPYRCGKSL